jgi:hypothetical protein
MAGRGMRYAGHALNTAIYNDGCISALSLNFTSLLQYYGE